MPRHQPPWRCHGTRSEERPGSRITRSGGRRRGCTTSTGPWESRRTPPGAPPARTRICRGPPPCPPSSCTCSAPGPPARRVRSIRSRRARRYLVGILEAANASQVVSHCSASWGGFLASAPAPSINLGNVRHLAGAVVSARWQLPLLSSSGASVTWLHHTIVEESRREAQIGLKVVQGSTLWEMYGCPTVRPPDNHNHVRTVMYSNTLKRAVRIKQSFDSSERVIIHRCRAL